MTRAAPETTKTVPDMTNTAPGHAPSVAPQAQQKSALLTPLDAEQVATPAPSPALELPSRLTAAPAKEQARTARPAPAAPTNTQATATPATAAPAREARLERDYLPAGTPRPRASLTEKSKAPSIGGLIHSMQAKPSNAPYYTAAITSVIWLFIGGLLGWLLVGQSLNDLTGQKSIFDSSSIYIMAAAVLVPIALFWFIAQLVTRSQEMKLMASAMTEVAIRLAEPDKMAEQKVASVGQTIRRQVSAMDDAISRAIGRAGELEALVHNEVAALERSYSQNEYIIRNLLGELVNERHAIAHNGQQVKETLQGVGAQVSRQIRSATDGIGKDLSKHSTMSTMKLQQAGENITQALKTTSDQTVAIKQKISAELPQLLSKMNAEQEKLGKVIEGANRNLGALDTTLAQRTTEIDGVISKHTADLNKRLVQKVKALDASLAMRTKAIDKTLSSKAGDLNKTFLTHREAIDKSMEEKAGDLDKTLLTHREAIDKTMQEKAGDLDKTLLTHREAMDTSMQEKAAEIDQAIASQAKAMDASLTEKARTIDTALTERLTIIEEQNTAEKAAIEQMNAMPPQQTVSDEPEKPVKKEDTAPSDLSMLRGSEALERAMSTQSENLHNRLEQNSTELEQTIKRQNELSPEITELKNKYEQLVKEQVEQATGMIRQFSAQGGELKATAGLLASADMKMSAMIGPQQDKARAILADLVNRSRELEQNRASYASALDNSKMLGDETAERLNQLLANSTSTRAEQEKERLQQAIEQCQQNTMEAKKWMSDYNHSLSAQVVELVSGMSRSTSRTRVLPGEMANTSTDVGKAVDEQLQALDALASISGAAINAAQASATVAGGPFQGQAPGRPSPPVRASNMPRASTPPRASAPADNTPAGNTSVGNAGQKPSQWSFGDLLARVAETDIDTTEQPLPNYRPATSDATAQEAASRKPSVALDPLDVLRMDDIARALDAHTAAIAWNRSQTGERNVFSQRLYTPEGQQTFQHITQRYHADDSFRKTVEKYVNDFEGMLNEADEKDPSGRIVQNYITSETGRAYLMLAHISGRLG